MKKITTVLLCLVLLAGLMLPCFATNIRGHAGLVYDDSREKHNTYDLYYPDGLKAGQTVNVVLCVHGGAWTGGEKEEMADNCHRFASRGYVAATVDYRLYNTANMITKQEDYAWTIQDMLDDVQNCLASIKQQVEADGYRVGNAALFGFSAGGHIALLYGYNQPADVPIPVTLLMAQSAPVDFHAETWTGGTLGSAAAMKMVLYMANRDFATSDKDRNRVSPAYFAKQNPLPTVAIYGAKDSIIGTGHKDALLAALGSNDHAVYLAENSGHTLENASDAGTLQQFYDSCYKYCQTYLVTETKNPQAPLPVPQKRIPTWAKVLICLAVFGILLTIGWFFLLRKLYRRWRQRHPRRS